MTPYYDANGITIWHGDMREMTLPWNADAVITDPPYGETSLKWDRWVDGWPDMLSDIRQLWCFGSMRMFLAHHADFALWSFGQDIVWEKHNGSGFHADRFKRVHEHAVHWYRGPWGSLHRQVPTTADATARAVRRKERPPHTGDISGSTYVSHDGGPRLQRSVIYERSCHGEAVHPTQKPLGILRPLIEYSSPFGGLVVDPFAGSGSTLIAARQIGRRAIGVEVDERYCETAARRLDQGALDFGGAV